MTKKKVFLGGTANNSTWRSELIPLLNKDKISYFNPVVKDWNEEAQQREEQEKETSDFRLYTITKEMLGFYAIAEVVDDSNKRPEKTIFCYLEEGFGKHQIKSLQATARLVKENGAKVFTSLEEVAEYLNQEHEDKKELNQIIVNNETIQTENYEVIELVNREEQLGAEEQEIINSSTITQQQLLPETNSRTLAGFKIPLWLVKVICCGKR